MQNQKTSPWLIAFRVIFTIALIACIVFIFRNSLQEGYFSSERSQAVMRALNHLLDKVNLGPLSEHTVRKLAHFAEFTLEGFLLPAGVYFPLCAPRQLASAGRYDHGTDG